jgi:predicted dehydrogenase
VLSLALVGCGRWGAHILRDLVTAGVRVVVVARDPSSIARARAGGAAAIVGSIDALPPVDGAVVATPTSTHAEVVLQLAREPFPIFCEKPLTDDPATAQQLVEIAGDRLFVMDKWRYHPGVLALAEIARSQELGPVFGVATERLGWGHPHADVDAAWILLPHDLAIGLEVLGEIPRPIAATAEVGERGLLALSGVLQERSWLRFEVSIRSPQHVRSVQLRCRDGVATLGGAYDDALRIDRTTGALRGAAAGEPELRAFEKTLPLATELNAFVDFVRGAGPAPKSSAAEGLRIVRAVAELRSLAGIAAGA